MDYSECAILCDSKTETTHITLRAVLLNHTYIKENMCFTTSNLNLYEKIYFSPLPKKWV